MELEFALKNIWVLLIMGNCVHGAMLSSQSSDHRRKNPELNASYKSLIRGFVIWTSLPWLVAALGITFGGVPHLGWFFAPRLGDPFVVAFHISVIVLWIAAVRWVFFRGGAEKLVVHPALFRGGVTEPKRIKLLFLFWLASGVVAMALMWIGLVPESAL